MQDILLFVQLHWLLSLAFISVLVILIALEFIKLKHSARQISVQQAVLLMNQQNAAVVDLRSQETFNTSHIVNAISLPLAEMDSHAKKLEKLKSLPIILVCANGTESLPAANTLINNGYQVQVLSGGMRGWNEANMPLVKGK